MPDPRGSRRSGLSRGLPGVVSATVAAVSLGCAACGDRFGTYQHGTIVAACGPAGGPAVSAILTAQPLGCDDAVPADRLELYLPGWAFDRTGAIRRAENATEPGQAQVCSGDGRCSATSLVDVSLEARDTDLYAVDYQLDADRIGRAVTRRCGELVQPCL